MIVISLGNPTRALDKVVDSSKGLYTTLTQSKVSDGSTAVMDHKDKYQTAELEWAKSFILCKHQVYRTHRVVTTG